MSAWRPGRPALARRGAGWYDRPMASPPPPSLARLASLAALIHLGFDSLFRVWTFTTPPYLLLPYMSEVFREMLAMLGVDAVSVVTSGVNGLVSAIFALALQDVAARRREKLGALLLGLSWLTGGLTFAVYLDAPAGVVAGSLAAGIPRAAALAFFLDRLLPRASPGAAGGGT
jgi:hypothetical protein